MTDMTDVKKPDILEKPLRMAGKSEKTVYNIVRE